MTSAHFRKPKSNSETELSLTQTTQVVSPFQAILNYEIKNNIPPGWVSFKSSIAFPLSYLFKEPENILLYSPDTFDKSQFFSKK